VHAGQTEIDGRRLLYCIIHDVTARKLVEARLQQIQAMLARAQAIVHMDSWTWDAETGLFYNPPRGAPNVGVEGPTVSWDLLMTIVHPDDRPAMQTAWADALAGRAGYDIEHRVVVDGQVRWLHVMAEVEHAPDGRPLRATGMTHDITARRQAEENLREARESLEHARAMARLDSWRLDLGTGMFTYPTYGSPNIGLDRPSLPWDDLIELIHPDDRAYMLAAWADALAGRSEYDIEHRMNINGEVRWIHAKAEIERDAGGRPVRATGMTQDITARRLLEDALREGEARHRLVMESAEDAIFITDTTGRYLYANPAALQALGYTLDEFLKLSVRDVVSRSELARFPKHLRAIRRGERRLLDWHLRSRNGPAILFELTTVQLPDDRFLAIGRDVTARRAAEEKLEVAASVFRNAAEGILITDASGAILEVNQGFTDLTGYRRDEVVGRNPRLLTSGHHDPAFFAAFWRSLLDTGQWRGEIWNRRKDGALIACRITISAARNRAGRIHRYISLFSDVTELKRRQEAVEHMAYHDALTQLPNRALLEDRLRQAIERADRQQTWISLGYLDLDGFKSVNDRFGHTAGDLLLVEIARRLTDNVRAQDTVARLGGDEFIVLLTDLKSETEWRDVFDRTLRFVAEPLALPNGETVTLSASLGVVLYPQTPGSPDVLLRHADQAMYRAKQAGRNRLCVYAPGHSSPVVSTD
jgi:diguanylate cyclase (GGDEF)-like protein/PAS domain S-box-containing protein